MIDSKKQQLCSRGDYPMLYRSHPLLVFGLLVGIFAGGATEAVAADPAIFIRDVGDEAIKILDTTMSVRQTRFRQLFDESFDVERCARFALGRYWRVATPEQHRQFVKLFEDYIVAGYSYRLGSLHGLIFKVVGSRIAPEGFIVRSEMTSVNDLTPVKVDWALIPSGRSYKITDVVVEGISMEVTMRSEFASIIDHNGERLDRLFALMRDKNASNLVSH